MKVRSARLLDLAAIESVHREAAARLSGVPPPARLWSVVSQTLSALLPLSQETLLYLAEKDGNLLGFVQASGQPLSLSLPAQVTTLQVLNLCVVEAADEEEVAGVLIDHLGQQAGRRGVRRLFVRIPLEDSLLGSFRSHGFRQYATESVLYSESTAVNQAPAPPGLRAVKGRDQTSLYHLYRKVTPQTVAQVEAPSYRDWRALRAASGRQELIERNEVVGWCRVLAGDDARPATISLMALPEPALVEELVDYTIRQTQARASWCSVRHYDSVMIGALCGRGFNILLHQSLLVRELMVREPVPEKRLVPSFG
ncbi:MAG TPA: hypothetical protein VMU49_02935 [Candidatus Acidoferrales bacterium]|nr:hypothetical protein [Candidatus Acidoferrales bacterium]